MATGIEGLQFRSVGGTLPIREWVINAQGEERLVTTERLLHGVQKTSIGDLELVGCDARNFAGGENDSATGGATFAFFDINPRPLDDELVKNNILLKRVFDAVKFACLRLSCRCWSLAKGAIQLHKMRAEAVDAKVARVFCEVGVISVGGQFQDMAEIVDTVVDRRRREKKHLLFASAGLVQVLLELAVARFLSLTFSGNTGVAEVVSLIN